MARRLRQLSLISLVLIVMLSAGLWFAREQLIHDVLRPWLAAQSSCFLEGEVAIDGLTAGWRQVELKGLRLVREDMEASIEVLRIGFTLGGLLDGRIAEVAVQRPDVRLVLPEAETSPDVRAQVLPREAPFAVDAWSLSDGSLQLIAGGGDYRVREIEAEGRLDKTLRFASSARAGAGEGVAVSLSGRGRWQDGLELTFEALAWDGRPLLQQPVTVRPDDAGELSVEVALPGLNDVETAALLAALGRPAPWPEGLAWQVAAPSARLRLAAGVPELQVATAEGSVTFEGRDWPWEKSGVALHQTDGAWQVDGWFGLAAGAHVTLLGGWRDDAFVGRVASTSPQPAALAAVFGVTLPAEAGRARGLVLSAGVLVNQEKISATDGRVTLDWQGVGNLAARFRGGMQGGKVAARMEGVTLTGRKGAAELASAELELSGVPATGTWQGRWQLGVDDLLALARGVGVAADVSLPNLREVRAAGGLKVHGDQASLTDVELTARLEAEGLSGRLQGRMAVEHEAAAGIAIDLRELTLDGLEYSNAAGTVVAVGGRLSLNGRLRPGADTVAFDLRGRGSLEEALAESWYGKLQGLPLDFNARGRWRQAEQTAQLDRAGLDLAGLATVEFSGRLAARTAALDGRLSIEQLSGRFQENLLRLGGELFPALNDTELAGALAVRARVMIADDAWRLDMDIEPDRLSMRHNDSFALTGLHGSLPVIVQVGDLRESADGRSGQLSWTRLTAPLVDTVDGRLDLRAEANHWQLVRPLEIAAAGGRARLKALQLSWQGLSPEGEAALSIADVDLRALSDAFAWPELGGRFSADLDGIRFSRDEIVTSGEASARAFGGAVRLHNLRMLAPLSRYPTYHADIEFSGINLHELTRTFAFGEINGVASGYVRGLRLFDGIPSAFDARFETAEGGTRNISVKAIRNLNTLSHGGLSAALSQGVYRFIDFYRYRKIGMACTLRNDVFHLTGTARPDSATYLIDGGWLPPKIDVVVSSPKISFKEMVKRLKRIERTER